MPRHNLARVSPNALGDLFDYDSAKGTLRWKCRETSTGFRSEHARNAWNARYAGLEILRPNNGYILVRVNYRKTPVHHIVWAMHHGAWPTIGIDHINGNRSDNRIGNLRLATATENGQNRGLGRNNTSGALGVSFRNGKWQAVIRVSRRDLYLGSFDKFEDAVAARRAAERRFGFHPNHGTRLASEERTRCPRV